MDLTTFTTMANAGGLAVALVHAKPFGGWGDVALIDDPADVSDTTLETAVVVALSKGQIVGAWSYAGWFLGNRVLTVDEAYERVYRG